MKIGGGVRMQKALRLFFGLDYDYLPHNRDPLILMPRRPSVVNYAVVVHLRCFPNHALSTMRRNGDSIVTSGVRSQARAFSNHLERCHVR